MFKKVKHSRLHEDIVSQIEEAFIEGKLKPGDRLPSERELEVMLGISRGTLRQAFRVLEQRGVIEIRTGASGGAYIKALTTDPISESIASLIRLKRISMEEVAQFRAGVEGLTAKLAAETATAEDIGYLKELIAEAEVHVKKGASHCSQFYELEKRMHEELVKMTRNQIYEAVVVTIHDNFNNYYDFLPKTNKTLSEAFDDWLEIVKALDKRQPKKVQAIMESHIQTFNEYLMSGVQGRRKKGTG